MSAYELTALQTAARLCAMRKLAVARASGLALGPALGLALGGCVTVNAPTEPIVIELNVNIRQEVIYRLAEDASKTIEENAGIF